LEEGMAVKLYADLGPVNVVILTAWFNDIARIEVGLLVPSDFLARSAKVVPRATGRTKVPAMVRSSCPKPVQDLNTHK
jgi:hypothetical protein